jgi:protein-S-isoprenylcysteine O-methyltransferase Ste14
MMNGAAVWTVSLSALSLSRIYPVFTLIYIRLTEEKELVECFGLEFLEHKRRTPFLLPRFRD